MTTTKKAMMAAWLKALTRCRQIHSITPVNEYLS